MENEAANALNPFNGSETDPAGKRPRQGSISERLRYVYPIKLLTMTFGKSCSHFMMRYILLPQLTEMHMPPFACLHSWFMILCNDISKNVFFGNKKRSLCKSFAIPRLN